ncbi:MAG: VOC family protein [Planctomycetia bacterium]|nr:VOC family protein [Planctomycetia bacterium]
MIRAMLDLPRMAVVVLAVAILLRVAPQAMASAAATYHHVHLTATNPGEAVKWYVKNMDGQMTKVGFFDAAGFGKITLIFFQAKEGFAGSVGSGVDHIGFSYKDLEAKMKQLADSGVEIVSGVQQEGPIKYAFVKDPWGTLIEVLQDPEIEGFHHVHLATTDPRTTLQWYVDAFGGELARFAGLIPGVRYGDMWVLAKKVDVARAPTKGRSIDHLGWAFADLDAAAVELKAKGVKFESGPFAFGSGKIAFITAPDGVRIELVGPAAKK